MKKHYLLAISCIVLGLAACKKNNTRPADTLIGKWYETKLTIHESNGTAVDHDTTFTGNSLTASDYIQFNTDKTAEVSQSGIYNVTGKSEMSSGGVMQVALSEYTYSISDSTLTLNSTSHLVHPTNGSGSSGFSPSIIIQQDANHLTLRTWFNSPLPFSHSETAYFIKKS